MNNVKNSITVYLHFPIRFLDVVHRGKLLWFCMGVKLGL
jgi:hypothetical protein